MVVPITEVQETGRGTGFGVGSGCWKSWLPNINSIIDSTVLCRVAPDGSLKLNKMLLWCVEYRTVWTQILNAQLLLSPMLGYFQNGSKTCMVKADAWWTCGANLSVTFPLSPLGCKVCVTCAAHPLPPHPAGAGPFSPLCTPWTMSISCSCMSSSSWHTLCLSSLLSTLHLTKYLSKFKKERFRSWN